MRILKWALIAITIIIISITGAVQISIEHYLNSQREKYGILTHMQRCSFKPYLIYFIEDCMFKLHTYSAQKAFSIYKHKGMVVSNYQKDSYLYYIYIDNCQL